MSVPQSTQPQPLGNGRPARPFVRLKMAASLDGVTALPDGRSQWITSPAAREDGHRWRARADCILTGIGTVLADDPRLDVRLPPGEPMALARQPALCIVDTWLRTPPNAMLFSTERQVHVFAAANASAEKQKALEARGASLHRLPLGVSQAQPSFGGRSGIDLGSALRTLACECLASTVHVEAGATLSGALLRAGLVDELLLYLAPTLLGTGRPMAALGPLASLVDGVELCWDSVDRVGPDLRVLAKVIHNF